MGDAIQLDPVTLVVAQARLDGRDPVAALLKAGLLTAEDVADAQALRPH